MKKITLLEPVVIAGVRHEPHEPDTDALVMDNEAADALIEAGHAQEVAADGLDRMTVAQLTDLVASEAVQLSGAERKAEIVDAIRAHRAAQPAPASL